MALLLKKAKTASVAVYLIGATYYLPNTAKVFQFHDLDLLVVQFLFDNPILLKCAKTDYHHICHFNRN